MGNEASKPKEAVAPPPEWDPASNAKKFELVSPMSDLSDPSMFLHRRPHPQLSDATVQQITQGGKKQQVRKAMEPPAKLPPGAEVRRNPGKVRQTSAGDRRRKSKVIATRDSAYKHEPRQREMPPPSSFYFPEVPTKESEDKLNRLSLRKSTSTGGRRQSKESENNNVVSKKKVPKLNESHENKENIKQNKTTPILVKAKRKVLCFKGCFEESGHNLQLMKDNAKPEAKRGQRLSSEAGTESGAGLLKETEKSQNNKAFDPYKQDPLPKPKSKTVLQFVDGAEKELAFNPVWRESHDGTYHDSTTTDSRRNSDESDPTKLGRVSNGDTTKSSRPSAASSRGADPSSQENNAVTNEAGPDKYSSTISDPNKGTKSGDDVEGLISKRESVASVATSHESSYWDGFYKETQVLHHEDAYFGRITYAPEQMSEPSPMANTVATPIAALFRQEEKPTSLLGRNDSESVDDAWSVPRTKSSDSSNKEAVSVEADDSKKANYDAILANRMEPITMMSSVDQTEDQQSSGEDSVTAGRTSSEAKKVKEGAVCEGVEGLRVKSEDAPKIEGCDSFPDRRISADSVLVQTALVSKMSNNGLPKRHSAGARVILQETPPSAVFRPRTSIGSAFSYKDKDVFTPVTTLATYPKGSPFRPRVKNDTGASMAKARLDQPAMFTQSFDDVARGSKDMEIQASKSAPSMMESHDYRDIALGCFLEDTPSTTANKKMRALSLMSPGVMSLESPMSTTMSPAQALLSNQVISNAAFLFSPSYADGYSLPSISGTADSQVGSTELSMGKDLKKRESSSISTLESRSRTFARSKLPIRIPGSSVYTVASSKTTRSRKSNMSDDASHQKSVRFSDASVAVSEAGSQKSRRSVTWDFSFKAAPQDVSVPAIETKVSDLSDTMFGTESLACNEKERESFGSGKPGLLPQSAIEEEITSLPSMDTSRPSLASTAGESLGRSSASGSRPSMTSTSVSQEYSAPDTPEQTQTWSYCEFSKGVTPMLDKKQMAQATNSPVLRFKAAKNKFKSNYEKEVPIKRKSPRSYKRPGTGRVHLLASKFDNGVGPAIPAISSMGSYASSGAGTSKRDDKPMLRTPLLHGYTPKTHQNIFQRASLGGYCAKSITQEKPELSIASKNIASNAAPEVILNEIPDDESDDMSQKSLESNDSTFVQSVATVRQEGREEKPTTTNDSHGDRFENEIDKILKSNSASVVNEGDDFPCDEADDDFAELLLNNLLAEKNASSEDEDEDEEGTVSTVPQQSSSNAIQQLRSVVSHDSEDDSTSFTNILSAPTFSDESTTMSAMLAQQTQANLRQGAKTVKPHIQRQHETPSTQSLFLSPVQRTPMQASKWRELANRAHEQDSKKSIFRKNSKKKRTGLSERDQNIA